MSDHIRDGGSTRAFYDGLASRYDLGVSDWDRTSHEQALRIEAILRRALSFDAPRDVAVLDTACGIGTQLVGLAGLGYRTTGLDLSPASIERCLALVEARGLAHVRLSVGDMRALPVATGRFDAVVCMGNSLPHLLDEDDVMRACREMHRVLRPGGVVVLETRSYDHDRAARTQLTSPQLHRDETRKAVTLQVWDWHPDGERYDLDYLQSVLPAGSQAWELFAQRTTYWAMSSEQIASWMRDAGFESASWVEVGRSTLEKSVLVARRS